MGYTFDNTINTLPPTSDIWALAQMMFITPQIKYSFILESTRKKRNGNYRVISFTNRKASGFKFISIHFHSNMYITRESKKYF